jgi:ABC-type antimicrobial peptide transport system permease subunit
MRRLALIFGLTFGTVGALFTTIVLVFPTSFRLFMNVIALSVVVGRALGIDDGAHGWLWHSLTLIVNTALSFSLGAVVGVFVWFLAKQTTKKHEGIS